jgi:hypothetical protein
MPLRYPIRDVLWLTLVVALATGLWLDRRRLTSWTYAFEGAVGTPLISTGVLFNVPDKQGNAPPTR